MTVANAPYVHVLSAREGAPAADPVRIFVGTEPAQYRAERVFLWSIEQVRDPDRTYEIHVMKRMPGFGNFLWNTAFTNYRFAVPALAGGRGRAIYNDVDQIYLEDPAALFDLDLDGHGYLAVSETDTSVMLIDCERMARCWTLEAAKTRRKYGLIDAARADGAFGVLPGKWNARDEEYEEGTGGCLHYTTIHKQPWRPFPERFHYQPNALGGLWFDLERAADLAGYSPFTAEQPSPAYAAACRSVAPVTFGPLLDEAARSLVSQRKATTLLEVVPGDAASTESPRPAFGVAGARRIGLDADPQDVPGFDAVVCGVRLDQLPQDDVPHVVERLFSLASARDGVLFAAVHCDASPRRRFLHSPTGTVDRPARWQWVFEGAARRHPGVHWRVACVGGRDDFAGAVAQEVEFVRGGPRPSVRAGAAPHVWVLADHKPGHTTQSEGLAAELAWPAEHIELEYNLWSEAPNAWTRGTLRSLTSACRTRLQPPWPDLVIATGRRTAPIASWVRRESLGATLTVQMGRVGAFQNDEFDLAVAPAYACLYPDDRRIETAAPVTRVSAASLHAAETRWGAELASAPAPRIALLVGGRDPEHEFDVETARRLGADVRELAEREGGSILATSSRRTSPQAAEALREALGDACAQFHAWRDGASPEDNPYLGYLAAADAIVVTGESASMLAEACATGKPVYIYPLPRRKTGMQSWWVRLERRLAEAVTARAYSRPVNRRGIERPQRGLEQLCSTLLARGFIRASGHSERLHGILVERDLARRFDGKLASAPSEHLTDVELVAARVREMMGIPST